MKISVAVVLCTILLLFCTGCGANLKSMRDVDVYLEKDKTTARDYFWNMKRKRDIEFMKSDRVVNVFQPSVRTRTDKLGVGLSVLNLAVGNVATGGIGIAGDLFGRPPARRNVHMKVSGMTTPCHRTSFLYSRKEPGKPDWDIGKEAIKLTPVPESNACVFEGVVVEPVLGFSDAYKGDDGEAVIANSLSILVWYSSKTGATAPCDVTEWEIYSNYVRQVGMQINKLAWRQFYNGERDEPLFQYDNEGISK